MPDVASAVPPASGGLVLDRKEGERIRIGDILVTVLAARRGATRLLISGPRSVPVDRVARAADYVPWHVHRQQRGRR